MTVDEEEEEEMNGSGIKEQETQDSISTSTHPFPQGHTDEINQQDCGTGDINLVKNPLPSPY